MKVVVIGAAGSIGREVVTDLVFRGYEAIVYGPDPGHVPDQWGNDVEVVVGALTDAAALDTAVARVDAVVNALVPYRGCGRRGVSLVEVTGSIVASMDRHGVRRYVGLSSPVAVQCLREDLAVCVRWWRWLLRRFHPRAYRQMRAMSQVVMDSGLDWTIVRYTIARSGQATGLKHVGFFGEETLGCLATEVDIARFTAAQVLDTSYVGAAPAVSN